MSVLEHNLIYVLCAHELTGLTKRYTGLRKTRISFVGEALPPPQPDTTEADITEDNMNDDDISKKQPL